MPNKEWKDCSITLNFSDTKSLSLFGKYVGHLPDYLQTWTLNDDEMDEVNAFCEVMNDEGEVTISSPLIDGGDEKTLFGMVMQQTFKNISLLNTRFGGIFLSLIQILLTDWLSISKSILYVEMATLTVQKT